MHCIRTREFRWKIETHTNTHARTRGIFSGACVHACTVHTRGRASDAHGVHWALDGAIYVRKTLTNLSEAILPVFLGPRYSWVLVYFHRLHCDHQTIHSLTRRSYDVSRSGVYARRLDSVFRFTRLSRRPRVTLSLPWNDTRSDTGSGVTRARPTPQLFAKIPRFDEKIGRQCAELRSRLSPSLEENGGPRPSEWLARATDTLRHRPNIPENNRSFSIQLCRTVKYRLDFCNNFILSFIQTIFSQDFI